MSVRGLRSGLTLLTVIALAAQMLAWASHTHASPVAGANVPLQCRALTHFSGNVPCPVDTKDHCALCWSHAVAGNAVAAPAPTVLAPPAAVIERLSVFATLVVAKPVAHAYRSRGPPRSAA